LGERGEGICDWKREKVMEVLGAVRCRWLGGRGNPVRRCLDEEKGREKKEDKEKGKGGGVGGVARNR